MSTVGRDEAQIRNYIRNQEKEDQRLEQLKLGERPATFNVAKINWGRISDPMTAVLSGSQPNAPGSAGGYLLMYLRDPAHRCGPSIGSHHSMKR